MHPRQEKIIDMIRILQVVSSLKKNGTETFIMNVIRELNNHNYKFDFLTFDNSKDGFYEEIINLGLKVYILPPRRNGIIRYNERLKGFFAKHAKDYDCIHFNCTSFTSILPLIYAKKYSIPIRITHLHGSDCIGFHNKLLHKINKLRLSTFSNYFLSCSETASNWGYKGTSITKKPIIIPNGIKLSEFRFDPLKRKEYRKSYGIKENDIVIIHVGMLHPVKNHKFLIKIIIELKKRNIPVKLFCIGSGELMEGLQRYCEARKVSDNIKFIGYRNDIANFLSSGDMFVFPSLHEGLGIALIEAQANGLPILASSRIPKEVKLSENFYFEDLNRGPQKWADKILEIIKKENQRQMPSELKKYDISQTLKYLTKIYSE